MQVKAEVYKQDHHTLLANHQKLGRGRERILSPSLQKGSTLWTL